MKNNANLKSLTRCSCVRSEAMVQINQKRTKSDINAHSTKDIVKIRTSLMLMSLSRNQLPKLE
jgi:hypothetical protein